jgi:nucleoside-diphosphate-sugar epimerase
MNVRDESRPLVLVTGAMGFVGRVCVPGLEQAGWHVRCALRADTPLVPNGADRRSVGDIGPSTNWCSALAGINAVVHLAARVHVMRETAPDSLEAFRATNVAGTARLAREAAAAGVKRFVFLSSVKVNGEATAGQPFTERDVPRPEDPYGISKREAEEALREIGGRTGLEVVILRPPLVYGPGVKANFLRLIRWVDRGVPLPLASVQNRRSLIYVGNLVDAVVRCIDHPAAPGETFLVDDGVPVSTPQLLRELGEALGRPARLLPLPPALLRGAARLLGRGDDVARLLGDLVVDSSHIRGRLGWQPPFSRRDGLAATARWFRAAQGADR